ncbi:hypothetical protein ALC62_06202, partial [Cyphomyrmex costatus]
LLIDITIRFLTSKPLTMTGYFRLNSNNHLPYIIRSGMCVQWPEGRCFHDVPEPALLNLYFEIRENCHGFS